jgi:hypothetical protein
MLTIALQFGLLALLLAVLAAIFSPRAIFCDDAEAAGVCALCLGHVDLLCAYCRSLLS